MQTSDKSGVLTTRVIAIMVKAVPAMNWASPAMVAISTALVVTMRLLGAGAAVLCWTGSLHTFQVVVGHSPSVGQLTAVNVLLIRELNIWRVQVDSAMQTSSCCEPLLWTLTLKVEHFEMIVSFSHHTRVLKLQYSPQGLANSWLHSAWPVAADNAGLGASSGQHHFWWCFCLKKA